ncbi:MAG: chorismate-binding protein, partial [Acidimicrobiia bacterium]|nr:chorismate-binding protein [Acidimicrobiia bacterium]
MPEEVVSALEAAESAARDGSWVAGFVSYDAAVGLDPHLHVPGRSGLPLVWFGVYETPHAWVKDASGVSVGEWEPSLSAEEHADRVETIKQHIRDGDTYQVNLTMAMSAPFAGRAEALLAGMVDAQPLSYGALIDLGDEQVVSVSPELLVDVEGRSVTMRPMKGTAPRGRSSIEDERNRRDLETSEKERSGNVMIVDMLRNDLGRVSEVGSVKVPALFEAERYSTVWQLTSTITAELRPDVGFPELMAAVFPSGSVTGAPKVSTMGIIADVETVARGPYCGAMGYIAPGGESYEFSVAIRAGVVADGLLTYHTGGGITADSDPAVEYQECLWKALVVTAVRDQPDLIETMRYEPGVGIALLPGHLRRLSDSARYWDIPFDPEAIGDALSAVESHRPVKVRMILFRNGDVEVEVEEIETVGEPVQLVLSERRIDPSEPHWFHKTHDRARYPVSEDGEVLMVNLDDEITETNISSVMVRFGDTWVTPPL